MDLRKNGKITQEQFFLALNKLRRANSGLNKAASSATTAAATPGAPTGADGDLKPGTPQDSVGSICVDAEAAARSDSENSVLKAPDSGGRPPAEAISSRPSQLPPVERHPAPPVPQVDGNAHGDLEDATAQPPEDSTCEARSTDESDLLVRVSPGGCEADRCSVPSEPKTFEIDHFVGGGGEWGGGVGAAAFGDDHANIALRSRGAVVEEDGGRGGESEWLFTPSGEKTHSVRRHVREAPEPLRHDSSTNSIVFGDGGGDSNSIINSKTRSTAGLSPRKTGGGDDSESGGGAVGLGSDNRRSRPPGREPKPHRQGDRRRSRSQPPTPSLSRGTGDAGRVGGGMTRMESGSGEKHDRTESIRHRDPSDSGGSQRLPPRSAAQNQRSPTTSRLDRGEQRGFGGAASPGCGKQSRSTQNSDISPGASEPARRASDKPLSARRHDPLLRDGNSKVGSQPSGALRRSRSLSQEGSAPARGPRRLCINSSSARSTQDHSDRYNTAAKYDQYGYPLHENQCLESGEAGAGTSGLVFTPTIKRLPGFYESRPKLAPASAKQYLGSMKRAGLRQSSSMYERGTGWKANVDDIR